MSETYAGQDEDNPLRNESYEVLLRACGHVFGIRERQIVENPDREPEQLPQMVKDLLAEIYRETKDIRAANLLAAAGVEIYIKGVRWRAYSASIQRVEATGELFFRDDLEDLLTGQDKINADLRAELFAEAGRPEESER